MYRIGVDVGGTNTDAALLDEKLKVIHSVKVPTSVDTKTGIYNALNKVITESKVKAKDVKWAMLGTTHCTNAIVERKRLNKVGVIRIGRPATTAIPPFTDWPEELREKIEVESTIVKGGYEFDGRLITKLDLEEVIEFCKKIKGKVDSVAISGVFSPLSSDQEQKVSEIVKEILGVDIPVTISSEIGSIGILERENGAILNSALIQVGKEITSGFKDALEELGVEAKVFFSQNDGTLMNLEFTAKFPIFTIGCGITNSIRGASFLSKLEDAIVLDIGGTTTDVGVLTKGFPRESAVASTIGGIHTNFRMPDMLSIGIGGGTIIEKQGEEIKIGPESVGYKLLTEALIFDGETLTLSDITARLGEAFIDKSSKVEHLNIEFCKKIKEDVKLKLENAIDQMKTEKSEVPVILTGGGSIVSPTNLVGASEIITPDHYKSANAVGAALGQVSGGIEKIYSLDKITRDEAISDAVKRAKNHAIDAGASEESIIVLSQEDIPLAYLPGNATLIKLKVVGDLKID